MKRLILIAAVIVGILGLVSSSAFAYNINGSLDDWGIDLSSDARYYLNGQSPLHGSANYNSDDDADIYHGRLIGDHFQFVGPGWSYYNYFDAEAMLFDNDATYAYIAVVTGLPKAGLQAPGNPYFVPGDIFIDIGNNGYDYGIKYDDGKLYSYSSSLGVYYGHDVLSPDFTAADPWRIVGSQINATTEFIYTLNPEYTHYVMEAKIPLSALGLSGISHATPVKLHWTMQCGNDDINLLADYNPIPEPATLSLLGLGLVGLLGLRRRTKL